MTNNEKALIELCEEMLTHVWGVVPISSMKEKLATLRAEAENLDEQRDLTPDEKQSLDEFTMKELEGSPDAGKTFEAYWNMRCKEAGTLFPTRDIEERAFRAGQAALLATGIRVAIYKDCRFGGNSDEPNAFHRAKPNMLTNATIIMDEK